MSLLSIVATVVGIFMALAGFPQAIKIYQRKSAKDISILTYLIIDAGAIVWILYGFELHNFPIIISNILGFMTSTLILIEYYYFGRTKK